MNVKELMMALDQLGQRHGYESEVFLNLRKSTIFGPSYHSGPVTLIGISPKKSLAGKIVIHGQSDQKGMARKKEEF